MDKFALESCRIPLTLFKWDEIRQLEGLLQLHDFHVFLYVVAVFSLHRPPLRPPHPGCQSPVLTPDCHPVHCCPSLQPPPPFGCVVQSGLGAAWRQSCPTIAAAGPEAQHRNTQSESHTGQFNHWNWFFVYFFEGGYLLSLNLLLCLLPTFLRPISKFHKGERRTCVLRHNFRSVEPLWVWGSDAKTTRLLVTMMRCLQSYPLLSWHMLHKHFIEEMERDTCTQKEGNLIGKQANPLKQQ